ncbi:hypothetical protein AAG593_05535 [Citromicrobium bathyomarinum]
MDQEKPTARATAKNLWSGYGEADTALSFADRTGISNYVGPSIVSALLTASSYFTSWAHSFGPLGVLLTAIGGFILGCVALIVLEIVRTKRIERKLLKTRKPVKTANFGLLLPGGNAFSPGDPARVGAINANVTIWNTGDPTYIVSWKMHVSVGDITYSGQYSKPNRQGMHEPDTGQQIVRWEESFESRRAAIGEEPIACTALFVFKAPLDDLIGPLATWKITLVDIYGNECSAEYRPGSGLTDRDWKE